MPSRTALVVLGMHRSGTSALARMLSLLGAALPKHVMGAFRGNEAGHWEPQRLVDLHTDMLGESGSRWDDWRRFEPATLGPERLSHYRGKIARLISEEYGDASLFVLKDPRLCRFVPLYEEVLGEMGIEPRFVLPHRNPVAVFGSLASRDDMSAPYASLVWLRHVLDAEEATRGNPRVFLAYEKCLDDWRAVAAKISAGLRLDWPRGVEEAGPEIDAYLSRDLQYHAATPADLDTDPRVGQAVRDAYGALLALTADEGDRAALETLSRVKVELESVQTATLGFDENEWHAIASKIFEEMAVRQHRDRRDREHLKRLAAKHQEDARKSAEAKKGLEDRLAAARHELRKTRHDFHEARVARERRESALTRLSTKNTELVREISTLQDAVSVQVAEVERLASEKADLQARHTTIETALTQSEGRNEAFKTALAESEGRNEALQAALSESQERNEALASALAALRKSTSWRLTTPLRAVKRLATDPRGTIAFLRTRGSGVQEQPAALPSAPPRPAATPAEGEPATNAARVEAAFDADFYLARYPDVQKTGVDPFKHFMARGWKEGRDPSPGFSTSYYLEHASDVREAGINPLVHWVLHGVRENRPVQPADVSPSAVETRPQEGGRASGKGGMSPADAARVEAAFDPDFYLARYPDVQKTGVDPFKHFMARGWKEGRDPSPGFSTSYYLEHAPDVREAGINPLVHWVLHGVREKRQTLPFHRRIELLDYAPMVSAIIPNYNHARFLGQRIDSILAQTYRNVEILILDDCSTDDSRAVIERYCQEHPDRIRALFNEENSGNVFRQWRKGITNVAGELVWICESDDFCDPDFLESLVGTFKDRSVNIAFGRIQFSDREGNLQPGLDYYRESAEPGIWDAPLARPARRWFAGGFGVNNVIANVGGCIFRRQWLPESVWEETGDYSVLGDWFLYCHLAGGGQIAYEPSAVAYFRQHSGNTSVASFVTPGYYEEHERLMLLLRRQWGVPDETVEAFCQKVTQQYEHHGLEKKLGPLELHCDGRKLLAEKRARPHILMAFLGFHPGGGEIFPIHLANALRAHGHLVSMLAFDLSEANEEMLATLDPAIPVYDSAWVEEYGADRFLEEAGISLIHSHMISLEWFFFGMCEIETEIPYLVTLHGSYEGSELGEEQLLRLTRGVSHFVYTAEKNLEPFRNLPLSEEQFTKLGNAMPDDPRPFPKTREDLGISEDAVVFTLVARGIQRKGWRAAINAFRGLREENPGRAMHLLLCGGGEETDRHFELHGTDPDITFLGYQPRINGLYRLSDVAIVPTRFGGESFPLILVQAMQTGTPVIATRLGEIESMVEGPEGPAGVLIENQRDTDLFTRSLQEAMAAMLVAPERERYARAAERKGETYSIDKVVEDYVSLYQNLLTEKVR